MKRMALFVLLLGASLLFLNFLTGCEGIPKNGYKPQPKSEYQDNSPVTANSSSESGSQSQFKTSEVKHFTQVDGLGLSPDFINSFYDGLREHLGKTGIADQIIDDGAAVPEAAAANSIVVEGKITEYKEGGALTVGIVGSEIKLYRRSDHTLVKTITARVPYKPSPFNTDKLIGKAAGGRTAYEIKKALP